MKDVCNLRHNKEFEHEEFDGLFHPFGCLW